MTPHRPPEPWLDAAALEALLWVGIAVLAVVCVAACAVPVLDGLRRRL